MLKLTNVKNKTLKSKYLIKSQFEEKNLYPWTQEKKLQFNSISSSIDITLSCNFIIYLLS